VHDAVGYAILRRDWISGTDEQHLHKQLRLEQRQQRFSHVVG
jgi:hypothetical protein